MQQCIRLAEALNEQGKTAEAIEQVNLVRERAGVALLNSNAATQVSGQDDMRTRIQNEYRWETAGEGVPSMKKCVGKPGKKASSTTLTVLTGMERHLGCYNLQLDMGWRPILCMADT